MEAQVLKRLFSVDEFHQMAEAGVFGEGDRLELLDGEVVQTTPIGSRHAACVDRLLLIEVADTTADHDRRVRVPRYALAGIPEVWSGELLAIPGFPGQHLAIDDILAQ
ncbi:MAG: hypothetical protein HY824_15875 [Acidobacteria bacterium]|nr:hypothetical protein [Acidobacteriota bacterium]